MRRFGFLLSRRWLLFGLAVVVLVIGTWWLGNWQFDRLESRQASNAVIEANEHKDPAPASEVMSTSAEVSEDDQWRMVRATGHYAVDDTVVVRYRTRDEAAGIDVVVPLITEDGTALLVDRGWLAVPNNHSTDVDIPAPPSGEVEVTGYVRSDGTGSSTDVTDHSTRAVSAEKIGEATGLTVYDGFVELASEDPEPAEKLAAEPLPELNDGPHFFYGLQWWFFGLLAVGGFLYLLYDEWRTHRRPVAVDAGPASPQGSGSDEPETPADAVPTAESTAGPAGRAEVDSPPLTAREEKAARKRAKAAKKQAVKDAYKAAYEKERSQR